MPANAVQHLAKYIFLINAHERDILPDCQANNNLAVLYFKYCC